GMGEVDDWSGASMLPSLYQALAALPRKHTFLFIGFTEEEKGLVGSRFYVRHLPPGSVKAIRAMVNLECLGLSTPKVWSDHAGPKLLSSLFAVARNLRIPLEGIDLERIGRDDAESFRSRKIPTITIHSLTQDTIHIMHTPRDNFSAINMTDYDESYRLVAAYLAHLDATLP
ncbi:MAG: M28 family metallopeptidase, partial [Terriglobia bacterium]